MLALGFGHENGGPKHLAHVELLFAGVVPQQILGEQYADHVVAVLADHRKTRVGRTDHLRHELVDLFVDVDDIHLRARDHDVAHLHLGNGECALDDRERVRIEQVLLVGRAQQPHQAGAVGGFAQKQRGKALKQSGSGGFGHCRREALFYP